MQYPHGQHTNDHASISAYSEYTITFHSSSPSYIQYYISCTPKLCRLAQMVQALGCTSERIAPDVVLQVEQSSKLVQSIRRQLVSSTFAPSVSHPSIWSISFMLYDFRSVIFMSCHLVHHFQCAPGTGCKHERILNYVHV